MYVWSGDRIPVGATRRIFMKFDISRILRKKKLSRKFQVSLKSDTNNGHFTEDLCMFGPGGGEIFRTCPDRSWGQPSLLYNGYRVFPGGKERPRRDADPSPPSSAVDKKE